MPNYDVRTTIDNQYGQLTGAVVANATTLTSDQFVGLPSDLSLVRYLPIALADDSQRIYEIVWATGHVEGSKNLTVIRGREGSAARQWGAGTAWRLAATARDGLLVVATRSALPTDAHLGQQVLIRDDGAGLSRVVQKGGDGWRAVETIFGHAGRTAGIQSATGVTVMTAAQKLKGGMTFTGGALVVPLAGQYLVTIRAYATGGTGRYTAALRVNGNTPAQGPAVMASKPDANDYSTMASSAVDLAAGDALTLAQSYATAGTTGYDGAYLEALYLGPA